MSECFSKFYIKNGQLVAQQNFENEDMSKDKNVYEVIRIVNGIPLFMSQHMDRLRNSVKLVNKIMLEAPSQIASEIERLIAKEKVDQGNVKLIFNYGKTENVYLFFIKHSYPTQDMYRNGVNTILYHGERENPNAKVVSLDFRRKVNDKIAEKKVYEAILVDNNGFITEGSRSNIFMLLDKKIITAPLETVLPGVTRSVVIDIINSKKFEFAEEKLHYSDIEKLDGLFITGTSPQILPINKVDDQLFSSAENSLVKELMKGYEQKMTEDLKNYKANS
ncbi:aminotransferase class IV [Clostridium oryzae]|uniref:D-alanine aminotransferase n=1 Tax=Clostridium oryzae TaxID=1450648 RepID=A0A1V4ILW5_9CLOT|nr:aminotransferase class IV [Clostridium oryzae]OPJ60859.1 D-alanine aminotransferase [Clostridium oryzae]